MSRALPRIHSSAEPQIYIKQDNYRDCSGVCLMLEEICRMNFPPSNLRRRCYNRFQKSALAIRCDLPSHTYRDKTGIVASTVHSTNLWSYAKDLTKALTNIPTVGLFIIVARGTNPGHVRHYRSARISTILRLRVSVPIRW